MVLDSEKDFVIYQGMHHNTLCNKWNSILQKQFMLGLFKEGQDFYFAIYNPNNCIIYWVRDRLLPNFFSQEIFSWGDIKASEHVLWHCPVYLFFWILNFIEKRSKCSVNHFRSNVESVICKILWITHLVHSLRPVLYG